MFRRAGLAAVCVFCLTACANNDPPRGDAAGDAAADAAIDTNVSERDLGADIALITGSCIDSPCTRDDECHGGFCLDKRCVSCKSDGDCTTGPRKCDNTIGACVACSVNAHCNTNDGPTLCSSGYCICETDAECVRNGNPIATGRCHNGACIGCTGDGDCRFAGSAYTRCHEGRCVPCVNDVDCAAVPGTGRCNGVNACFGCTAATDCDAIFVSPLWQCR